MFIVDVKQQHNNNSLVSQQAELDDGGKLVLTHHSVCTQPINGSYKSVGKQFPSVFLNLSLLLYYQEKHLLMGSERPRMIRYRYKYNLS